MTDLAFLAAPGGQTSKCIRSPGAEATALLNETRRPGVQAIEFMKD